MDTGDRGSPSEGQMPEYYLLLHLLYYFIFTVKELSLSDIVFMDIKLKGAMDGIEAAINGIELL